MSEAVSLTVSFFNIGNNVKSNMSVNNLRQFVKEIECEMLER